MRVGMGYDVHRLVENRDLIIGGVTIPYEKGLLGHSDADVLLHAISDALLGAAALGDIGKHFPDLKLFRLLILESAEQEIAKVFLVKYRGRIIGGSFCVYSGETAYLCFSGGLRKRYAMLYPGVMAVWGAIQYAYEKKYAHFEFVDAGLPFKKVGYRNFILGFGGKQVSTRRWFRFRWMWLNRLAKWLYR